MNQASKKIDINLIQEEVISIEELKIKTKEVFDKCPRLKPGSSFDNDVWPVRNENTKTYNYIDWSKLNDLKIFNKITINEIDIIKCWIGNEIVEGTVKVKPKVDAVIDLILKTSNFEKELIKGKKGNAVLTYINSFSDKIKFHKVNSIKEYLFYLEYTDLITDEQYLVLEDLISISGYSKSKKRKLPNESDILTFDYYLKYFFNDKNIEENMKLMFYPLLIWWKVTNVIPMRPVELCTNLKKDCLENNNKQYYIHINRAKVYSGKNKKNTTRGRIPLLSRIAISEDIYNLINKYIELTDWDNTRKTLFSYRALKKFRKYYGNYNENIVQNKIDEDYFTTTNLSVLIDKFYKMVMNDIYSVEIINNDKEEKKIKIINEIGQHEKITSIYGYRVLDKLDIGDTRHIAFTSLLLQGVSPIEIAMLGGHTSLSSQDYYQGHAIFYADSEIINFVTQKNTIHKKMDTTLKDIVFSKSETPPRDITTCLPTDDSVGYCTIDTNSNILDCTGDDCLRCKHWWCEPSKESYEVLEDYFKNNIIKPIEKQIILEEKYLKHLLANKITVTNQGLIELDKQYENNLFTCVKRLNRNITLNKYNLKSLSENKSVTDGVKKMFGGINSWQELKDL